MKHDSVPFLEVPGNLTFMMNIDWFQSPLNIRSTVLESFT